MSRRYSFARDSGRRIICTQYVRLTPCRNRNARNHSLARPDLNLLFTLDVLLAEGSVARAARRLHLSPSAMSRALARLREATGDPLLVRAGRGLVASPRALELRDAISQLVGSVDLETGVVDKAIGPEVRAQALFRDRYVGVVRAGHPLSEGDITPAQFAAASHVHVSRRDSDKGPIDDALAGMGLQRQIATTVGGFAAALALVRATDWVACVHERHTGVLYAGMHSFALPVPIPQFTVSLLWHPRLDGDPAHRWLRGCVRGVCAEQRQAE